MESQYGKELSAAQLCQCSMLACLNTRQRHHVNNTAAAHATVLVDVIESHEHQLLPIGNCFDKDVCCTEQRWHVCTAPGMHDCYTAV